MTDCSWFKEDTQEDALTLFSWLSGYLPQPSKWFHLRHYWLGCLLRHLLSRRHVYPTVRTASWDFPEFCHLLYLYGTCFPGAGRSVPVHHLLFSCQILVQFSYFIFFILGTYASKIYLNVKLVVSRGDSFIHKSMFSLIFNQKFNLYII